MNKLIFLLLGTLQFEIYPQGTFPQIPPNVVEVKSFGYWQNKNEDEEGNYRLVVFREGYEHIKNFAFIESIKSDSGESKVVESFAINEINEPAVFVISETEYYRKENKDYIKFYLIYTYSLNENHELELQLSPNAYKVINFK